MILLLLTSSTGISYAQHFCGDFEILSEITFGKKELSCGIDMKGSNCDMKVSSHNCCDNHYTSISTDDHFAKVQFQIDFTTIYITISVPVYTLQSEIQHNASLLSYAENHPPPLEQNLLILFSTFLI